MISRIHQKLGTAGFIISIVALVAALGGGAYAASGGLSGKQKKEVEKIAKQYAGKPGATGPTGPAGPKGDTGSAGAKGDTGTKGDNGAAGSPGSNGANGTNGKSVVLVNEQPELCPNEEGFTYQIEGSASANEVCSAGAGGGGLPKTLGPEETETGTWTVTTVEAFASGYAAISFPVPLAAELDASHVILVPKGGPVPTNCEDGVAPPASVSHPEAKPGYLCVFKGNFQEESGTTLSGPFKLTGSPAGASFAGAILFVESEAAPANSGYGSWAVTGTL